ncbi:hypothetical protein [Lysobacter gummosus]
MSRLSASYPRATTRPDAAASAVLQLSVAGRFKPLALEVRLPAPS